MCVLSTKVEECADVYTKVSKCVDYIEHNKNMQGKDKENIIDLLNSFCLEATVATSRNFAEKANSIANMYFILGYLKALLSSKVPLIDPVLKISLKKKYCMEEITHAEALKNNYEVLNLIYSDSPKTIHAYCKLLALKIEGLRSKINKYEKYVAVRPSETSYKSLTEVRIGLFFFSAKHYVIFFYRLLIMHFQVYCLQRKF